MKNNLLLFIVECLRWDRKYVFQDLSGTLVKTVTQGTNTPSCIPTILTGKNKRTWRKWFFGDKVKVPTVFDLEQMG